MDENTRVKRNQNPTPAARVAMKSGEELALAAMKKELTRLSKAAERAKNEADEYYNIGSEAIAIHEEFYQIVKSGRHGDDVIKKLGKLKVRDARVRRIMKKDFMKLLDKESSTRMDMDNLESEVQRLEFRLSLRKDSSG